MTEGISFAPKPKEEKEVSQEEVFTEIYNTFTRDMIQLKAGHKFDTREDWAQFFDQIVTAKEAAVNSCPLPEYHKSIGAAYGLVKAVVVQEMISQHREKLKENRSEEIFQKLHDYSLHAARWQTNCLEMIKKFEDFDYGQEFIGAVWSNLADLSAKRFAFQGRDEKSAIREANALKNGILSLRMVNDVMEYILQDTGAEVIIPTPEEDVEDKTDLKVVRGSKKCAIQIKSSYRGLGNINCERVNQFRSSHNLDDEGKKKVTGQNALYEKIKNKHIADEGLWIEVLGRPDREINQVTGKPSLEYLNTQSQGETGQNVRAALGIEQTQSLNMAA